MSWLEDIFQMTYICEVNLCMVPMQEREIVFVGVLQNCQRVSVRVMV